MRRCKKKFFFFFFKNRPIIFCLQKLSSLNVSAAVLQIFYRRCIESVLTFSWLCWFGGLNQNVKSKNVLNKVVNVCGKVVGERQSQLCERRVVRKARVIVDDNSHVLAKYYELLPPCGRRFRVLKSNTVRTKQFCSQ